jgi:radical SAM-linked protein
VHRRYRFTFEKLGEARWLSHRQIMDALERILRAAGLPVRYTEGFNPHIRLSMGPALAVGHEGEAEIFDVDCTAPITRQHVAKANELLPDGVRIVDAQPLMPGAPSLGKLVAASRYRISAAPDIASWPDSPEVLEEKLRDGVISWQPLADGGLRVELNARQDDGPLVSVKKLLLGIGIEEDRAARVRATREMLILKARQKKQPKTRETGATV